MTTQEEQRRHWSKELSLLKWLVGIVAAIGITVAGAIWQASRWVTQVEGNFTALETKIDNTASEALGRSTENRAIIDQLRTQAGAEARALSTLTARIEAQGDSIKRIDENVTDLLRYLRGQGR